MCVGFKRLSVSGLHKKGLLFWCYLVARRCIGVILLLETVNLMFSALSICFLLAARHY